MSENGSASIVTSIEAKEEVKPEPVQPTTAAQQRLTADGAFAIANRLQGSPKDLVGFLTSLEDETRENVLKQFPEEDSASIKRILRERQQALESAARHAQGLISCKSDLATDAEKVAFIQKFGLKVWESLPLRPEQRIDITNLTREQYSQLPTKKKCELIRLFGLSFVEQLR